MFHCLYRLEVNRRQSTANSTFAYVRPCPKGYANVVHGSQMMYHTDSINPLCIPLKYTEWNVSTIIHWHVICSLYLCSPQDELYCNYRDSLTITCSAIIRLKMSILSLWPNTYISLCLLFMVLNDFIWTVILIVRGMKRVVLIHKSVVFGHFRNLPSSTSLILMPQILFFSLSKNL